MTSGAAILAANQAGLPAGAGARALAVAAIIIIRPELREAERLSAT
jgi:hypothetical protein